MPGIGWKLSKPLATRVLNLERKTRKRVHRFCLHEPEQQAMQDFLLNHCWCAMLKSRSDVERNFEFRSQTFVPASEEMCKKHLSRYSRIWSAKRAGELTNFLSSRPEQQAAQDFRLNCCDQKSSPILSNFIYKMNLGLGL